MTHLKETLIAISLSLGCLTAGALPARQEIKTVAQPDGTTLNIRVVGDENLHFTISDDGMILTQDSDGYYRLAEVTPEGMVVSTGVRPESSQTHGLGTHITDVDFQTLREGRIMSGNAPQAGLFGKKQIKREVKTTGSPKVLVFLVEYSDVKFSTDFDVKDYFTRMMTEDDFNMFGGTGSAMQYFKEQSKGQFTPTFDVYGPVTLPENQAYYGGNYGQGWDMKAHYMVSHAAKALDSEIDFSKYDSDNDGYVDFIYVFYAGQGEHNHGGENTVWPHAGSLNSVADFVQLDKKWLDKYACSNEMEGDKPNGLGPLVHEYSHILGLPDLYASTEIVENRDFTPGPYSVLDYGVYNNDSRTPCNYTAYERQMLKWDTPLTLDHEMSVTLDNIASGESGLIPADMPSEYYLLENRQQVGWDSALPAHGLLIWHIDNKVMGEGLFINPDRDRQTVNLVEANEIEAFVEYGDGYTFPGTTGKTSFTSETSPALRTSAGEPIDLPVTDITEEGGMVSFDIAGGNKDVETGIEAIGDEEIMPVYYNLQGIRVESPVEGTVLIERRGATTRKVIF